VTIGGKCESGCTVVGDREQLAILLANLVSNAIAYSEEGSQIEVGCGCDEQAMRLSVRDHGIGIREDALPHIFEEYYRTNEASRFNRLSTGLGLAIVREIADRFGFTIRVTSEIGKGTEFQVSIPGGGTGTRRNAHG
jgi:two-component system phosphate regulon sensor histidine kinase PhoR